MWRVPRILLGTLLSLIAVWTVSQATIARAQVTEADILKGIELARNSGAAISDQEVEQILQGYRQQTKQYSRMQEELQWETQNLTQDLEHPLSHIKGQEGIPFPNPEQIVFQPEPSPPPGPSKETTPRPVWSPEPYTRPIRCEKNETKRTEHTPNGDDSVTYVDRLFLSEDLVPLDENEVYGPQVSLVPYGPHESKGTFVRMEVYRVPCVPYRMRSTGKADYIDTGLNALKNYTSNPAGKGVFHTFVDQKLHPEKYAGKAPTRPQRR